MNGWLITLSVVGALALTYLAALLAREIYARWTERLLRPVSNGLATVRAEHAALRANVNSLAPKRRTGWYHDQFVRAAEEEVVTNLLRRIEALENPKDIKSSTKKGDKK